MDARTLVGLLSERDRLRVVAALALGASTLTAVAEATGLDLPVVGKAVRRLEKAGLVAREGRGAYVLRAELFKAAAMAEQPAPETVGAVDPAEEVLLRAFFRHGRLTHLPTVHAKTLVVLRHLADRFEPGVHYLEPEVNAILTEVYPDYALLRRGLVDEGLLSREAGVYWRSGGYVDVLADDPGAD
ncbi:MAG: DUF2087 domain-containing protein [Geodermatophilaceae bacterium]|nr:DUF2087 domain-containing protein [Geodermatophilaceae bacterium]